MAQLFDAFGMPLMRRKQSHLVLSALKNEQVSSQRKEPAEHRESSSPKKDAWPPENRQVTARNPSPTFSSRIFENSNYDSSKATEFRNKPIAERRLQRDSSDQFLRSLRITESGSKSATDLHCNQPAGQFKRQTSKKKMFEAVIRETSPSLLPADGEFIPAAGMNLHRGESTLILNAAKIDHIAPIIQDRKARASSPLDTAYNRQYSRQGFEPRHTPEKKTESPIKVEASDGPYVSKKRYPFEVKSRDRLL